MIPRLFISRGLSAESPLLRWAIKRGMEVMDQSLLRFTPHPFQLPEEDFDWIFFYSSRAVEFFWTPIAIGRGAERAKKAKIAAIGRGTASTLASLGYYLDFVGNGDPEATSEAFAALAAGQTVLFPRAQQSRMSIQQLLGKSIQALDIVVYSNEGIPPVHPIRADIVMLTSPLNVRAWFTTHPTVVEDQRFIAIGPSTAGAIEAYGVVPIVAQEASETGLLRALQQLL